MNMGDLGFHNMWKGKKLMAVFILYQTESEN